LADREAGEDPRRRRAPEETFASGPRGAPSDPRRSTLPGSRGPDPSRTAGARPAQAIPAPFEPLTRWSDPPPVRAPRTEFALVRMDETILSVEGTVSEKLSVRDLDVADRRVFCRVDFNV